MASDVAFERRIGQRVRLAVEVTLDSESQFFAGLANDISRGGVFVSTYRDLPIGDEVILDFDLGGVHVVARGAVRWKRPASDGVSPGFGVAFLEMDEAARRAIESFCAVREPLYVDLGDRVSQF